MFIEFVTNYKDVLMNLVFLFGLGSVYIILPFKKENNSKTLLIVAGLLVGFVGIILMNAQFDVSKGFLLDTRSVLVSLTAAFLGFIPALISVIMLSALRLFQAGTLTSTIAWGGVLMIFVTASIGLIFRKYRVHKLSLNKISSYFELYLFGLITHIAMILCFYVNPISVANFALGIVFWPIIITFPLVTVPLGIILLIQRRNVENIDEIIHVSYHDSLTGLHNRRYYDDNIAKFDITENYPLTVVMSDINGLKLVNDAFGHTAGDMLLIETAKVISNSCRETDLIARIGGDEFIIIMPNTSGIEAEKIIGKIHKKAKKVFVESIGLSISFGFDTKNEVSENIQETFRSAEDLMYRVKLTVIPSMRSGAIDTILKTLYEKDKNSEIHSRTVSKISEKIATFYGMNRQEVNEVKTAGLLHDIGKIIIPISIITKKGKLTSEEYSLIKGHPEIGFRILNSTQDMRSISNIVLNHHERWDGLGYPRGIKSDEVPVPSRIIAIADAFDAMTSTRTYRDIFTYEQALKELIDNAGTQFDPELVEVFKLHFDEIILIK